MNLLYISNHLAVTLNEYSLKMKPCILWAWVLLPILSVQAIGSNTHNLNNTIVDSIEILQKNAKNSKSVDMSKAIHILDEALLLAKSINHDSLTLRVENTKALYLLLAADYGQARSIIERLIPQYEELGDLHLTAVLHNRLANIDIRLGKFERAKLHATTALKLFPPRYKKQKGISYIFLGEIYRHQLLYEKAFKHIEYAIELMEEINNDQYINMALTELGRLQLDIEDYDEAKKTFLKTLELDVKNKQFLILPNLCLGKIEFIQNNLDKSKSYLIKTKQLIQTAGDSSWLATTFLYQGKIALKEMQTNLAGHFATLALKEAKKLERVRVYHEAAILNGHVCVIDKNNSKCISEIMPTYEYAVSKEDHELWYQAADLLATSHTELDDLNQALHYHTVYQKQKEHFQSNQNAIFVKGLTTKYNINKVKAIEILEKEQFISAQKNRFNFLLLIGIFLSILSYNLSRQKKQKTEMILGLESKNLDLRTAENKLDNLNAKLSEKNIELESYIETNLQLENFAHIASHDLKAPLRDQASFIQLLEKDTLHRLSEKEKRYLNYVSKANTAMQSLIEDMIEYSHVKSDDYSFEAVNPKQLIKEAEYINRDIIIQENAKVIINEVPESIQADKIKLTLVFRNLLLNSLQYRQQNVTPVIEFGGVKMPDHSVFWIKDNGSGINPKFKKDVFTVFKRLRTQSEVPGNGLGLAMVKEVIQKHNGKVWMQSEKQQGTIFYFSIADN